jgi:2-dehydro-3-deoxyphosphogluconate aldolase/(4S)-4-hydroxy-2-oxoglutarate aldolase
MNRADLARLRAAGVVAVLRAPSAVTAVRAVDALVAGGITGIEITYSTADAAEAISEVDRRHGTSIYLGAGVV